MVSVGAPDNIASGSSVSREAWVAAAADPLWLLWGKARPKGAVPAHPLICHMLDVASVAMFLFDHVIPPATRSLLSALHPGDDEQSRTYVAWLVAMHDYGKAGPAFQAKVPWIRDVLHDRGFDFQHPVTGAYPHGILGMACFKKEGVSKHIFAALQATCAHHGEFPRKSLINKCSRTPQLGNDAWRDARASLQAHISSVLDYRPAPVPEPSHAQLMALAGFAAVSDWIGSMDDVFTYVPPPTRPEDYWSTLGHKAAQAAERAGFRVRPQSPNAEQSPTFSEVFHPFKPWPLHQQIDGLTRQPRGPSLFVIEAPMGEGKTEAAFLLAEAASVHSGHDGMFVGLPTKATANQMHGRVLRFLKKTGRNDATLMLAHGDARLFERTQSIDSIHGDEAHSHAAAVEARRWFQSKKRRLLAPYAVGTVDQALRTAMLQRHQFVGLSGLAGKTIILDEVHAFDAYTSALMARLLEWLGAMDCTVVLLSATLPSDTRKRLTRAYAMGAGLPEPPLGDAPYPRISVVSSDALPPRTFAPRGEPVTVALEKRTRELEQIATDLVAHAHRGACAGHITNTVARAQELFELVQAKAKAPTLLVHSRLFPGERRAREQRLESWLGQPHDNENRPNGCVVVGTQVLEQSLDIDFDILGSDLAPIDLLIQRMGRLHRHGKRARPASFESPTFQIEIPTNDAANATLKELEDLAFVYTEAGGDFIIRKTLSVLARHQELTLPSDIEGRVADVYDEVIRALQADADDHDAALVHVGDATIKRQIAHTRLIPSPGTEQDIFRDLKVSLADEEDLSTNPELRADTRLGDESLDVVFFHDRDGDLFLPDDPEQAFDIGAPLSGAAVDRLVRHSISISRNAVVSALYNQVEHPAVWNEHAMLRHRRHVRLIDGEVEVEGTTLRLDPTLGLVLS